MSDHPRNSTRPNRRPTDGHEIMSDDPLGDPFPAAWRNVLDFAAATATSHVARSTILLAKDSKTPLIGSQASSSG
jgi:hypothetical protein